MKNKIFYFITIKRYFLAQNRVTWRINRKNRSNGLACRLVEEPKQCSSLNFKQEGCIFHLHGEQKPLGWLSPIFFMVAVHDVMTSFKFGDDRFRSFWLAEGQILPFPIDFEGSPYNTHIICEVWYVKKKKKKIPHRQLGPLRGSSSPWRHFEPARAKPN